MLKCLQVCPVCVCMYVRVCQRWGLCVLRCCCACVGWKGCRVSSILPGFHLPVGSMHPGLFFCLLSEGFFTIFSNKAVLPPRRCLTTWERSKQGKKDGPPPSGSSQAFRCLSGVFGFVLFCFLLRLQTRLMITSNNLLLIVVLCRERHFPQTRAVSVS